MPSAKITTLRIPSEEARRAEIAARADGVSVSEALRRAPLRYFELKGADAGSTERLRAMLARDAEL